MRQRARVSLLLVAALLLAAWLAIGIASLCVGTLPLTSHAAWAALTSHSDAPLTIIVRDLRLPRFIACLMVGASLALAGTLMQNITGNALADPSLTGVVSSAALAVVAATVLAPAVSARWHPLLATAGAAAGAALTFALSWRGTLSPLRLSLAGSAVAALSSAGVIVLMIAAGPQAGPLLYWLAGGFAGAGWRQAAALAPWTVVGLVLALGSARVMDALALGDEAAESVGIALRNWRLGLGTLAIVLSATVVANAGPVGFVGLCAPHAARLIAGSAHRLVLPFSALTGGLLVCTADLAARTVAAPRELPVGFLTALVAAPFLIQLIRGGAGVRT
ncbi:iron complex transport system permease protein [Burkholderia sp. OK233]|nr:iron complex transport system permease protein [Burkholderia sp. OK233]